MEQPKKIFKVILASSLVSNVFLLAISAAFVTTVVKIKRQVDEIHQRLEDVRGVVEDLKEVRASLKERVRERRRGEPGDEEPEGGQPRPRRPLQRLRQNK